MNAASWIEQAEHAGMVARPVKKMQTTITIEHFNRVDLISALRLLAGRIGRDLSGYASEEFSTDGTTTRRTLEMPRGFTADQKREFSDARRRYLDEVLS